MANSRSEDLDDSIPEIIYECISLIDENSCKKDELYVRCPLCKQFERTFYCVECVKNGNFLHSKKKCFERFADKKVSKYKLDDEKAIILQSYEDLFSKKKKIENMKLEIYKSKEKIQLLKASIQSCKGSIYNDVKMIEELKKENTHSLSTQSIFNEKLFKMRRHQKGKNSELDFEGRRLDCAHNALQAVIHQRIKELITHIFPINKISSSQYHKNSSSEEGQFAELEEAQKTTYVQGQWVIAGNAMDDTHYSIVEPCIASSGDYSAYINWCTEHIQGISRDSLSAVDKCQFDKAYGISAALAYTTQVVGILAFYMDAYMPKRCSFSDFCGHESSKTKFLHKVAKLNANIVSLCLSRGVDVSKINAHRTIENILLLLKTEKEDPQSNTTTGEEMEALMESIENSLSKDMLFMDESDSDEMEAEFVHVSEEEFFTIPDESLSEPPPQTSLVSSFLSLFNAGGQR